MIVLRQRLIWLVSIVYFMQGCSGITGIALPLFLRRSGLSIQQIAAFMSLVTLPWFFKIIYGIVSDAFPIFGLRRKPYLIVYCLLACAGWVLMALIPPQYTLLAIAMTVVNLGFAAIDVVTDGIVVEHSTQNTTQIYQSAAWGARSGGALLSGVTGGYLASTLDYRFIFVIAGIFPLIAMAAIVFYKEKKVQITPCLGSLWAPLTTSVSYLRSGDLFWFCVILTISALSASFLTPLFFYMRETLLFTEKFLGILSSAAWAGAIVGCFLYLQYFKNLRLKRALVMAILIGFFQILSCMLIQDRRSALIISMTGGILGYFTILPMMSAAAKLANGTGVEGSLFAILMSIFNLAQAGSTLAGGFLFERFGLHWLIIGTAVCTLSGLLVIRRLKTI